MWLMAWCLIQPLQVLINTTPPLAELTNKLTNSQSIVELHEANEEGVVDSAKSVLLY